MRVSKQNCFLVMFGGLMIAAFLSTTARAQGFKEGQWSMTMTTKMDNMPPEMAASMQKARQEMDNLPPEQRAQIEQMQQKMGFSMNMDGQGMTMTVTHCMTKQNPVPKYSKNMEEANCQQTHEIDGNTVHFRTTCDHNDMQMEAAGEMTYSGDTMEGHIKSHVVKAGKTMDSTVDITGLYLGPCP